MTGVTIDVTDRRDAETNDRWTRQQLEAVFRGVVDGITIRAPNGALLFANDAAAEIIGFPSARELLTVSTPEIMRRFAMLDAAGSPLPLDQLPGRRALRGEHPPEIVVRYRRIGFGEDRRVLVRATPVVDDAGAVLFAINIFRDMTDQRRAEDELRHSEARYRLLFESSPFPMWIFDAATLRFLAVNDAALHHYGYRRDEFLALILVDIRPPRTSRRSAPKRRVSPPTRRTSTVPASGVTSGTTAHPFLPRQQPTPSCLMAAPLDWR